MRCGLSPRATTRCGVPGVTLNVLKPDEVPSGMRGNRDRAMK